MAQNENIFKKLRLEYKTKDGKTISLRQLEKLMDKKIAYTHISELENGATPSLNQLKIYHDFFGVSYDALLDSSDNSFKRNEVKEILEYMSQSIAKKDQAIKKFASDLLTTDRGYALLFYLTEYFNDKTYTEKDMAHILNKIKNIPLDDEYNSIRIKIDNSLNKMEEIR